MTDVVGSASFELRAKKDKLAKDVRDAETDLKASVDRIERDYAQGGQKAAAAFGRSQKQMARDAKLAETEIRASAGRISAALIAAAGAFAVGAGANATVQLSDAYLRLTNSLKVAGLEGQALAQVQDALFATAIKNGVEVETLGQLYGRAAQAAGELGASQADLLQFTDGVSAAIRVQGGSAASASGAIIQLSQALQAGTVRAEEFNSINEGARPILEAVANGSERFGGSVAKLRAEVLAGTVTSEEFFAAFLKGSKDLEDRAAKSVLTVEQGMTNLQTALIKYVGESAAVQGATTALANGLKLLAENLDIIIPSIAAVSVGIGVAYVGGVVAATGVTGVFTGAVKGLNVALTVISRHPIIAALSIIAAGLAFVALRGREASQSMQEIDRSATGAANALDEYEAALREAEGAAGDARDRALEHAAALRVEAQDAIKATRAQLELAIARRESATAAAAEAAAPRARDPGEVGGSLANAAANLDRAVAEEAAARQRNAAAVGRLARIEQTLRDGGYRPPGSVSSAGASGGRPAAADSAAREILELERDILAARASGDQAAIEAAEERLLLAQTVQKYVRAGYEDAAAAAREEVAWLNEIEALDERRAAMAKLLGEYREADVRRSEEAARQAELESDMLLDQLAYEAEIARLKGDPTALRLAERRLFIEQETLRLIRQQGDAITEADARSQAERKFDELEEADLEGRAREDFRRAFSDGIRAAIDGDLGGFFESLADRFTDRLLDNLADDLFDILQSALKGTPGGGIGGGILSSIGSFLGFGGGRAAGGPVSSGMMYRVGEHGPETLVMPGDGYVIPNGARMGPGGGQRAPTQILNFDLSGAVMTADLLQQMQDMAIRSGGAAAQYAKADTLGTLRKQQDTRRGGSGW